ncbi:MAG TPA: dienelactone hydrolase family protein [Kofleriaceae bacterium]|nr:dienelactone hydrolase family protein [Kofleriaceae bacterium]
MTQSVLDLAGLSTRIIGPDDALLTCVLMHGFGAPGHDMAGLAGHLSSVAGAPVRFVFPAGPLELGGMYGDSHAWWMIDMARLEADLRRGAESERRAEIPDGLDAARDRVLRLLDELTARFSIDDRQFVIGGFSQGAMLALDVALHRAAPPAALIVMSGTLIAEPVWRPLLPRLAGVPVMVSHGRQDQLLPYASAELLRDQLAEAGAVVDWQPFLGGHEIPRIAADAAGALLRRLAAR